MDDAVVVRRAASDAIRTVEPEPLRQTLLSALSQCSTVPGVMVLESARSIDGGVEFARLSNRVVGVQLVYAGLGVTRRLADAPPWTAGDADEANMDVLAADILVARGAHLLAGTEASDAAVEVIRSFGRDQTRREGDPAPDYDLETDVFQLATVAGATAVGSGTPQWLLEWAADLSASLTEYGATDGSDLPELSTLLAGDPPTGPLPVADDGRSADDGRVTSSGDR